MGLARILGREAPNMRLKLAALLLKKAYVPYVRDVRRSLSAIR